MNRGQGPGGKGPINSDDITVTRLGGQWALVVQPVIPDDAPGPFKNALAVRRAANTTGVCPGCGARMAMPNRAARRAAATAGRVVIATFVHDDDCAVLCDGDGGTS
ncbi:hypothetical protein QQY66_37500 [Streptomyces sp. DG2A-72]|uniref:hypothetical protein n=1 Tax=Streptomyces sp. DG2A-72 TaxID=3051386 RepID=UPI00265C329F|nr:hypothetical protein [Streptomyces sp. DG2A-72]MDO0937138.1 hypothetical protein [Streptomyces sp. DG2A-72]